MAEAKKDKKTRKPAPILVEVLEEDSWVTVDSQPDHTTTAEAIRWASTVDFGFSTQDYKFRVVQVKAEFELETKTVTKVNRV